jgi:hypothetical protein
MPEDQRTARHLTEADLDAAAEITVIDQQRDIAWWKEHGSPLTNRLLDAKPSSDAK